MVSKYWGRKLSDAIPSRSVRTCPGTGVEIELLVRPERYGMQRDCPGMALSLFHFT